MRSSVWQAGGLLHLDSKATSALLHTLKARQGCSTGALLLLLPAHLICLAARCRAGTALAPGLHPMLLLLLSWQGMLHRPADLLLLLLLTVLSVAVQMEEMSCCQSPAGRQQAAVAAAVPAAAVRLLLLLVVAGRGPAGPASSKRNTWY